MNRPVHPAVRQDTLTSARGVMNCPCCARYSTPTMALLFAAGVLVSRRTMRRSYRHHLGNFGVRCFGKCEPLSVPKSEVF